MYEHHSQPLLSAREFVLRLVRHGGLIVLLIGVSLALGMSGYHAFAHMGPVDAFLNASMILGGMGPVGELPNDTAKIFAGCYALFSGIVLIAVAGLMIAPVAHRVLHRLHLDDAD